MDLLQREQPEILAGKGVGYRKSGLRHTKALTAMKDRIKVTTEDQ